MASISACHAEDPGSIPGLGVGIPFDVDVSLQINLLKEKCSFSPINKKICATMPLSRGFCRDMLISTGSWGRGHDGAPHRFCQLLDFASVVLNLLTVDFP